MKPLSNFLDYYAGYLSAKLALGLTKTQLIGWAALITAITLICIHLVFTRTHILNKKKKLFGIICLGVLGLIILLTP